MTSPEDAVTAAIETQRAQAATDAKGGAHNPFTYWEDPATGILPTTFQDSPLAELLARTLHDLVRSPSRGWMSYTGKLWEPVSDAYALEVVRVAMKEMYVAFAADSTTLHELKMLAPMLTMSKVKNVTKFLEGILEKPADIWDQHPDLLNVQNGVVDLITGTRYKHNRDHYMTKIARAKYLPGARHADWDAALEALPVAQREWLQVRFGQAVTGYMTDDDVLPIFSGGGQNGKSTILNGVASSLGDHAQVVPERVLMANPGDHPTELTVLQGARMAMIEETPEGRHLPTKRLKDLLGTPEMTARRMRQDNETWRATHSLFLATNFRPVVAETDWGTWRRLALVNFPYTFKDPSEPLLAPDERHGNRGLRERIIDNADGQLEAVLAWVVLGARAWYDNGRAQLDLPPQVKEDTQAWREETDLILAYASDRLSFDGGSAVIANELFGDFSDWLSASHRPAWSEGTFSSRFAGHDLTKRNGVAKSRPAKLPTLSRRFPMYAETPARPTIWTGVKFA